MVEIDRRVRALAWVTRRIMPVTSMTEDRIVKVQKRGIPDNAVTRFQLGAAVAGASLEDRVIPGPGGDLPVRVYRPRRGSANALIVYFHGGGFAFGALRMGDWLCSNVAVNVGTVVVSVDYRLAPVHKFPAAVEDCYAATEWVAEHFGGFPLGLMGESAGANLAAVTCLLARDSGGPVISHQVLLYPPVDMTDESRPAAAYDDAPFLSLAERQLYRRFYLGDADPADPRVSPLRAKDHAGLPPALIQTGEHDPLRDGAIHYADALRAADVPVRLTEYVGMPHGFMNFPNICRAVPQALSELCAEQRAALTGGRHDGR
jgi:acetyl esterase